MYLTFRNYRYLHLKTFLRYLTFLNNFKYMFKYIVCTNISVTHVTITWNACQTDYHHCKSPIQTIGLVNKYLHNIFNVPLPTMLIIGDNIWRQVSPYGIDIDHNVWTVYEKNTNCAYKLNVPIYDFRYFYLYSYILTTRSICNCVWIPQEHPYLNTFRCMCPHVWCQLAYIYVLNIMRQCKLEYILFFHDTWNAFAVLYRSALKFLWCKINVFTHLWKQVEFRQNCLFVTNNIYMEQKYLCHYINKYLLLTQRLILPQAVNLLFPQNLLKVNDLRVAHL